MQAMWLIFRLTGADGMDRVTAETTTAATRSWHAGDKDAADAADLFHGDDEQGEAKGAQKTADQAPRQAVSLDVGAVDTDDADGDDDHGTYLGDREGFMEDEVRQDHDQDGTAVAHEGGQADANLLIRFIEEEPVPGQEEARQDQPAQGGPGHVAQATPFMAGRRQEKQE